MIIWQIVNPKMLIQKMVWVSANLKKYEKIKYAFCVRVLKQPSFTLTNSVNHNNLMSMLFTATILVAQYCLRGREI
jgi:hypothetical protein